MKSFRNFFQPMALLPKRPTDLENDIDFGKNRMSSLSKAEDHQELERLGSNQNRFLLSENFAFLFVTAKVQRCREEREKIIREESMPKNSGSNTRNVEPRKIIFSLKTKSFSFIFIYRKEISSFHDVTAARP